MVVPRDTGDLIRSLVRVPGSGRDPNLEAKLCDLSRVSTLAAREHINTVLPKELVKSQAKTGTSANDELCKESSGKNKQACVNPMAHGPIAKPPKELVKSQAKTGSSANDKLHKRSSGNNKQARFNPMARGPSAQPPVKPQSIQNGQGNNLPILAVNGVALLVPSNFTLQPNQQHGQVAILQPGMGTVTSLSLMLEELKGLKTENAELQKRISLFQQLFRDKKRLASVVQRLQSMTG